MRIGRAIPWFLCAAAALCTVASDRIDPDRYLEDVKYLASEGLRGRGTGTDGLDKAAGYIARRFDGVGLKPAGVQGYFQPFAVTTHATLGNRNRFECENGAEKGRLALNTQFRPLALSAGGRFDGPVVFVGYGITAPEYKYDDYAGVDAKDKIVLLLRHEPQEWDDNSIFAGKVQTNHAQLVTKAINARLHGARGVLLVADRFNHRSEGGELEKFAGALGPDNPGIPFVQISADVVDRWLSKAGRSLDDIGQAIDKNLRPESFPLPVRASITVDISRKTRTVFNIAGYLEGETPEYLIVGAHYDHLGLGEQFSMAPSQIGTPHLGADDNASGTAGLLELSTWFSKGSRHRRGLLFLAFAAEEIGLVGSSYYVSNPRLPLSNAVAMINLDMIGRIREGKVYIGGVWTGASFKPIIESLLGKSMLHFELSDAGGYGSSDHFSFTPKDVPVLFFFSGLHEDYHKPSDTWEKINAPDAARLLDFVAELGGRLLDDPDRPMFVRGPQPREFRGSETATQ